MNINKIQAIYFLLFGVIYFIIFAYDIENDRDYWTWLWLLNSLLSLLGSLRCIIKADYETMLKNNI